LTAEGHPAIGIWVSFTPPVSSKLTTTIAESYRRYSYLGSRNRVIRVGNGRVNATQELKFGSLNTLDLHDACNTHGMLELYLYMILQALFNS
jgi:hypothetical protein